MIKKGMIQDFMLETDSLEVFEQYLRLTVQVSGVRCIEKKGCKIGGLAWEYPSESVWQEMDDALLTRCPELYRLVCRAKATSPVPGSMKMRTGWLMRSWRCSRRRTARRMVPQTTILLQTQKA